MTLRLVAALCLALPAACTPTRTATPLPPLEPGHPLLGTWEYRSRLSECVHVTEWRADGTMTDTVGESVGHGRFWIAPKVNDEGVYEYRDEVDRGGGLGCGGQRLRPHRSEQASYIATNPAHDKIRQCAQPDLTDCYPPKKRKRADAPAR